MLKIKTSSYNIEIGIIFDHIFRYASVVPKVHASATKNTFVQSLADRVFPSRNVQKMTLVEKMKSPPIAAMSV